MAAGKGEVGKISGLLHGSAFQVFKPKFVNIRVAPHLRPFWLVRVAQVRFTDQNERI
jgi:hypothetical protein